MQPAGIGFPAINRDTSGMPEKETEPPLLEAVLGRQIVNRRFPQNRSHQRTIQMPCMVANDNGWLAEDAVLPVGVLVIDLRS